MKIQEMNDVAKETLAVLDYFDTKLLKKVPKNFLDYLKKLAEISNYNVYIDEEKELMEQKIMEETKDLIALIYYSYIADSVEKKEIENSWNKNEKEYVKLLEEKYNPDNIFKNIEEKDYSHKNDFLINSQKTSLLNKIVNIIKRFFNI